MECLLFKTVILFALYIAVMFDGKAKIYFTLGTAAAKSGLMFAFYANYPKC